MIVLGPRAAGSPAGQPRWGAHPARIGFAAINCDVKLSPCHQRAGRPRSQYRHEWDREDDLYHRHAHN